MTVLPCPFLLLTTVTCELETYGEARTMSEVKEPVELMNTVTEKLTRADTLHFGANVRVAFRGDWLCWDLIPLRMQAWYERSQWRIETQYRDESLVWVWSGTPGWAYALSHGRWTRRDVRFKGSPEQLKLWWFLGFGLIPTVSYVSMVDDVLEGIPVWVVEGVGDRGQRLIWWICKDALRVRKWEYQGGNVEFQWKGEKKQARLPLTVTVDFDRVEFDIEVPKEYFAVPPEAQVEETDEEAISDVFFDWLDRLITQEECRQARL